MNAKKDKSNKSLVWQYYIKENNISSRCKLCTKVLKHGGNTTNLMQHLQRKHTLHLHPNNFTRNDDKENIDKNNACTDEQPSNSNSMTKKDNSEDMDVDPDVPNCSYNVNSCILKHKTRQQANEKIDDAFQRMNSFKEGGTQACNITNSIAYMIAKDNLPLLTVENEGFIQLMKTVAPLYTLPSRKTITRLLDAKYEILKCKFIDNIQHISSFTITCDIWTDISNKSYLGLTIHYLKTETLLTKTTIGVIPLEKNHTSEYIQDELLSVLQIFKIDSSKIIAVCASCAYI